MSNLYIVATPIGNLEDITLRALRILKEADMILCEDTRVTRKLLSHYEISTPMLSYHAHSKVRQVDKIFELLRQGKDLALVSDAGTPTISDPGVLLVQQVKSEFDDEVQIIPIPGPTALAAALCVSGISSARFSFLGFLPTKKGRETIFGQIGRSDITVIFYESPHRILKTIEALKKHVDEKRKVTIAREITKLYEDVFSGSIEEVRKYFEKHPDKVKGEFVVIIEGIG
ncbi:MAG: 16S rRNA (cytidine(1402)-2'-O)-methyltransferase [Candidatus Pacebacteria bacterium]|nr:16S rRNA (cytidine(1402)-2'-O)-methyltransferase [Candidatus Paceibacterota bacterium]